MARAFSRSVNSVRDNLSTVGSHVVAVTGGCIHSLHTQCARASGEKIQGKTANQVLSGFRKIPDPVQALKVSILRPNQSVALLRSRINDAVGQRQLVAYT